MAFPEEVAPFFLRSQLDQETQLARQGQIGEDTLSRSRWMKSANFEVFDAGDLENLFEFYDGLFFEGRVRQLLGEASLKFRISARMTSAGAKTFRYQSRQTGERWYEIAVAGNLLFDSFDGSQRDITVCGRTCSTTLEALQRLMEHELLHLVELLVWSKSSCSASQFQSMARRFFGHTDFRHALITPKEQARDLGIHVGAQVRFEYEGQTFVGRVNRITKRATVLVESRQGRLFNDGFRYETYYIPLEMLERV
ncbi:MAG: hypothetical protein KDA80_07615 [Planctomycetaceae bacterium]|nr:hypothetical protein [Planctomycetaceae bacterium]